MCGFGNIAMRLCNVLNIDGIIFIHSSKVCMKDNIDTAIDQLKVKIEMHFYLLRLI
jgi:hypothetical protein